MVADGIATTYEFDGAITGGPRVYTGPLWALA